MRARLTGRVLMAAILLAKGGTAAAAESAAADPCAPVSGPALAVAEAIDGDTLRLADGRAVHIAGIEAVKPGSADPTAAALAAAARDETRRLTADGVAIAIPLPPEADRYGRLHAVVQLADGRSAAAVLVAAGLARVRLFPGEKPCLAKLLAAESGARTARRGLWALPDFAVRRAGDPSLTTRTGLYDLVEGRIASIGHGKLMVFLDFGKDFRRDFTIMVPLLMVDSLPLPVDALKGRRVRVRGVIEDSGGPAIRLGGADEIELLDGNQGAGYRGFR